MAVARIFPRLTVLTLASIFAASIGLAAAPAAAQEVESDHSPFVGRVGLGWFGVSEIPLVEGTVAAPALGVRYWLDDRLGVDFGAGFLFGGSSLKTKTLDFNDDLQENEEDGPSTSAFLIHAGLPVVLAEGRHTVFLVIPEANIGYASLNSESDENDGSVEVDSTGVRLDAGVRAGLEIHFGFMGLPRLSLEGTVGAFYTYRKVKREEGEELIEVSTNEFTTSVFNNPWDFFTANVAARYYF